MFTICDRVGDNYSVELSVYSLEMKKLFIALSLMLANGAFAQTTMSEALKSMPDSLMPYLTHNNRLDCIDFCEANMKAEVRNVFEGKSELLQLTSNYALFRLNDASSVELVLLNTDAQQFICMIQTYGTDLRESVISFYTTSWQQLPTEQFLSTSAEQYAAQFDAEQMMLILESNNYLNRPAMEEQKEIEKLQIKLKWASGRFKKS